MKRQFDPSMHVDNVGRQLVMAFDDAGGATTPVLVGSAREVPVREKLENLLPKAVGVGEGCVIDSYKGTSKQQDLVLYEKDVCPIFSINNTPESTYYPCESVMAVIEVKSSLDNAQLNDAIEKIKSVKELNRKAAVTKNAFGTDQVSYRQYGTMTGLDTSSEDSFDQKNKSRDRICGFILAGTLSLKPATFFQKLVEKSNELPLHLQVDYVCVLDAGLFIPGSSINGRPTLRRSRQDADGWYFFPREKNNFLPFFSRLSSSYFGGRTVCTHIVDDYIDSRTLNSASATFMY